MTGPKDRTSEDPPKKPRRCKAQSTTTGQQCGRWSSKGQLVCAFHGGNAPRAKAAAARRMAEEKARTALETYGRPIDTTPTEALLEEVRWTAGHVQWLRDRVRELEQAAVTWGVTEKVEKTAGEFPGVDTTHAAAPNVWVDLYARERKHLVDVCKAAISAGIEERRVRLAESQGALLASVIHRILGDLNLTPDQRALVSEVVPRHLRAVA
jgi:hypothetical protein